jgi:hypothetical protein
MICLISPTYNQARKWADTQNLLNHEWFYASDETDLLSRMSFHVLVIGEFPEERLSWFEKIYATAKRRGRLSPGVH